MKWVFICGAHSVGKTTLCNYLHQNLVVDNTAPGLTTEVARSILKAKGITNVSLFRQALVYLPLPNIA